jgi:DNA polymerase elongation subunit (family B)
LVRKKQAEYEARGEIFQASVCNGLQLAYKIVCNSVYGQLGCSREVGPIAYMDLAACTTATGRYMVLRAKEFAEIIYPSIFGKIKQIITVNINNLVDIAEASITAIILVNNPPKYGIIADNPESIPRIK